MSGIVGVWSFVDQRIDSTLIERMLQRLAHRGSNEGIWGEGAVALGSRLLWTTPESLHERLPLQRGAYVITADARIDNRSELFSALNLSAPPSTITDSELILRAYERWGTDCAQKLLGDFAFAIWDNSEQKLFCARDPMGVKLLYYYHSRQRFAFASEISPLLGLPDLPRELNDFAIADYLIPGLGFLGDKDTFFQSVFSLPAGHMLIVRPGQLKRERYWAFDPHRELRLDSDAAYEEAFAALLMDAVQCRLRSAFPVGAALSGGLDSSVVTCTARVLLSGNQPLHTYYLLSPVSECDERSYVNTVLASGAINHHELPMPSPLAGMDELLRGRDSPSSLHNHPLMLHQYQAAKQDQVRVFLDGIDGDAVIGYGSGYLVELAQQRQWRLLARNIGEQGQQQGSLNPGASLDAYVVPALARLLSTGRWKAFTVGVHVLSAELNLSPLVLAWRAARLGIGQQIGRWKPGLVQRWTEKNIPTIHADFAQRIKLDRAVEALLNKDKLPQDERADHYQNLTSGKLQTTFSDCDQVAAAASLDVRHPLSDRRLAEFCLALPSNQKYQNGWMRSILRRSTKDLLPEEIRWRPGKTDFGPHIIRSLLTADKALLDELILGGNIATPYLNETALRGVYQRFRATPTNADARTLLRTAKLLLWLRHNSTF